MVSSVYKATFYEQWQYATDNDYNSPHKYYAFSNIASDDMYGGGGQNDLSTQSMDHLLWQNDDQFDQYWTACYSTISRANVSTGDGFYSFCAQLSWIGAGATTGHYQASHAQALVLDVLPTFC